MQKLKLIEIIQEFKDLSDYCIAVGINTENLQQINDQLSNDFDLNDLCIEHLKEEGHI